MKKTKSWLAVLSWLITGRSPPRPVSATVPKPRPWLSGLRVAMERVSASTDKPPRSKQLMPALPMPGIVPAKDRAVVTKLAMDSIPYGWLNTMGGGLDNFFKGYPYLAQLSQMPEYRNICQTIAEEMTRKGIIIKGGDDVDEDKISQLTELIKNFKVMEVCRTAIEQDGFFGRSHVYIDVKSASGIRVLDDGKELETELFLSPAKVKKDSLIGFTVVEAMWTYPGVYNSTNPLADDYYRPQTWYVMGFTVHRSRLLEVISQPVPDILKAAYSFGGLSLTQIAEPYVDNWIRTRNSVGDLVHSFSLTGLKTNLAALLQNPIGEDDPSNVMNRIMMLNKFKDNRSAVLIDKDSEEFFQINTPIAGLHELQAQAQEHICSVTHIPLVKYTGLSPTGLNASSDGEIRVWYDFITGRQNRVLKPIIKTMLEVIQLSTWGKIDDSLTFEFAPLYEPTPSEIEELRKSKAETDKTYIDSGVLSQQDIRSIIVNEPESRYASIEDELPEDLEQVDEEVEGQVVAASGRSSGEA